MKVDLINTSSDPDLLNEGCGAEYVHKEQSVPRGFHADHRSMKCITFDGDADRQIYFYETADGDLKILDGDKQFVFIMRYIIGLLKELGIEDEVPTVYAHSPYTNLKAIQYYEKEGIKGQVVRTGVKNAHPVIVQYPIGANDEPNGHGTVAYKEQKLESILKEKGLSD